jgi:Ca2+-binding EF-hand superfamily protein
LIEEDDEMIRFLLSSCIGLLMVGTAWAQMPIDADGDGAISLPELQSVRPEVTAERFVELDASGDGLLTRDELQAARSGFGGRDRAQFADIDTDGDSALSLTELQAASAERTEERFNRIDANDDGLVTVDEGRALRGRGNRRGDHSGSRRRGRDSDDTT